MFPCLVSLLECLFLPASQDPSASNRAVPEARQHVMAIMRRGPEDGKGVQVCHQPQNSVALPAYGPDPGLVEATCPAFAGTVHAQGGRASLNL